MLTSSLMENLIEHLNAEICSESIFDINSAMKWLKSTFFYIRARKNPKQYKIPETAKDIDVFLKSSCFYSHNYQKL
jgi:ATP-dependent DNA helicase HFM1/MER3